MIDRDSDNKSAQISRRRILAASAGVSTIGLAGCVDRAISLVGQSAAENVVSNKDVFPAALFGGDSRPDSTLIEMDHTYQEFEIVVSGEYQGTESSI
jgi:hypothetical protein